MKAKNQAKLNNLLIPVLSVLMGMIIGAIIMVILKFSPIKGYQALFQGAFGSSFYIGETLRQTAPLILTALGFAVANIAGFFNIGVAGQALLGWLCSIWFTLAFPNLPGPVSVVLSMIVGASAGAIWAGIAGVLRAFFDTSEVIVTIMLNHISLYFANYVIRNFITESADTTARIPAEASLRMEWLTTLTKNSTLHTGIFISLIMAIVIWVVLKKTTLGFEIRSVGLNPFASRYAGMSTKRIIIMSMLLSGALAGLGGSIDGLGNYRNIFVQGSVPSLGFDGLAVALLGLSNPIGIIFASLLFGALKVGGTSMPLRTGIPVEVVDIVIAFIIFFVGANYVIRFFIDRRARQNVGPAKGMETASAGLVTNETLAAETKSVPEDKTDINDEEGGTQP